MELKVRQPNLTACAILYGTVISRDELVPQDLVNDYQLRSHQTVSHYLQKSQLPS